MPGRLLFFLLLMCPSAHLQTYDTCETAQADSGASHNPSWEFSSEIYFYHRFKDDFYAMPVAAATRGEWHLEARYNYENFRSFSFFTGRVFTTGNKDQLEVIPLLGGVVGNTSGIVPGMEIDFLWKNMEFYSEAEYVFDLRHRDSDFFYNWAEIRYYLGDWVAGITSQQTREAKGEWSIDNGIMAGLNYSRYSGLVYLFHPNEKGALAIFTIAFVF